MKLNGQTLKDQRLAIGVSQEEMGRRAGVSRSTIIEYEKSADLKLANILEAYGLEAYPTTDILATDIDDIGRIAKKIVEHSLGVKCKVTINVELLGDGE